MFVFFFVIFWYVYFEVCDDGGGKCVGLGFVLSNCVVFCDLGRWIDLVECKY